MHMNDQNSTPQPPKPPQQDHEHHLDEPDIRDLKTAQNFVMVASFAGPISVFIGGILLSSAGLICGILGFRKLKALEKKHADHTRLGVAVTRIKRSCIIALTICGIALVLNIIAFSVMYPIVLEAVESGNYAELIPGAQLTPDSPENGDSIWG